ncbi:ABC transporter ATP-binding protein [Rubellimicrobium roseum]|uniref:ABC transporter ATP-binding protein n=1 Tax=Rubellimicrobium roseum TaxID=687525 RepID=A0A5C4N972_9RHOB|nr:ABC transporter ATP-binding protein [Rubellimicrobium roseum]TNC71394.1 ABC transporter ATP-binding protein [Rubellimicrobium roseum]
MHGSLRVSQLGKRYRVVGSKGQRTLRDLVRSGFRRTPAEYVWGLRDVSFEVEPGRTVGVVGRNGAGKSSLLRLIAGVGRPDEGSVEIHGRTGAVLDIGAGLTDDLTGRENMMLAGLVAGMSRREVQARAAEIIAFAELEDAIDAPLRTYSTGMKMRLAFSVAIHVDPDILLIDEVLAVGDATFQRKCLARINEIKASGRTIFFVSHDASLVRALCDDVLYLRKGRVVAFGPTTDVMPVYEAAGTEAGNGAEASDVPDRLLPGGRTLRQGINRFGTLEAEITAVRILRLDGAPTGSITAGAGLMVEIDYAARASLDGIVAAIAIKLPNGTSCFDTNTQVSHMELPVGGTGSVRLRIERLDLVAGDYTVAVGLYDPDWKGAYDSHYNVYGFNVIGVRSTEGVLNPPARWELTTRTEGPVRYSGTG